MNDITIEQIHKLKEVIYTASLMDVSLDNFDSEILIPVRSKYPLIHDLFVNSMKQIMSDLQSDPYTKKANIERLFLQSLWLLEKTNE